MALIPDGRLLLMARGIRSFAFGSLSVVLALYLAARGLSPAQIGLVLSGTLVEDAILTAVITAVADRIGRRRVLSLYDLALYFRFRSVSLEAPKTHVRGAS